MRSKGTPSELEKRRKLAIQRFNEGYNTVDISDFLGVDSSTVRRWIRLYRKDGMKFLKIKASSGRPPYLGRTQEKIVLRWLRDDPRDFGFETGLWTCSRLVKLILEEFGVRFNDHYLANWLRKHGMTPQKPQRVPIKRNLKDILKWRAIRWPQLVKKL
jgi:transposase